MAKKRRSEPKQTAGKPAPVELTGDAGGGFEAEVAAYFLAEMLRCASGMGEGLGQLRRIRFQTKDAGSELDDLGLELVSTNDDRSWASVSVKRNRQVTQGGFPFSFVEAVWRQRLAGSSDERRSGQDLVMLAVGELAGNVESAWQDMLHEATEARGDESRLVRRWTTARLASRLKRQLFASLHCACTIGQGRGRSRCRLASVGALVRSVAGRYRGAGLQPVVSGNRGPGRAVAGFSHSG